LHGVAQGFTGKRLLKDLRHPLLRLSPLPGLPAAAGEHDRPHIAVVVLRAKLLNHLARREIRQSILHNQKIRLLLKRQLHGLLPIHTQQHLVTFARQYILNHSTNGGVIVDHQNFLRCHKTDRGNRPLIFKVLLNRLPCHQAHSSRKSVKNAITPRAT
jgi:hypothetical protein